MDTGALQESMNKIIENIEIRQSVRIKKAVRIKTFGLFVIVS